MVFEDIKFCCNWDVKKGEYVFFVKKKLQEYWVLIIIFIIVGRLVLVQFFIDYFIYIFIDEVGYCMEFESLVVIVGLMEVKEIGDLGGQLVLVGDFWQLGFVLCFLLIQKYGLGYLLLEWLFIYNFLYKKGFDGYDFQFIIKLFCNYRFYFIILDIFNQFYYEGELQVCVDVVD